MTDGARTAVSAEDEAVRSEGSAARARHVLYAVTPKPDMTIGVVCDAEPSSLALLAAGAAGMAARRARRERPQK
jgi:hypothetical protein